MCGYVFCLTKKEINQSKLRNSLSAINYRGPDESKILQGKTKKNINFFLGFNRLSIYDLHSSSMQPFNHNDSPWIMLFNGSIYNFKELREKLKIKGHKFLTEGDTEVVYLAFKEFGSKCFKLFNGMWSIILFNKLSGDILMCRDRLGIKPLYYQIIDDEIFVASEPICFLEKSQINFEKDIFQINKFINCAMHDDDENTFFKNVKQLAPNTFMKINIDAKKFVQKNFDDWNKDSENTSLKNRLINSINLRTVSDVPNFSLLSGGLDSSLIAKIISNNKQNNFKGFVTHAPMEKNVFDESEYAKKIYKSFNTNIDHLILKNDQSLSLDSLINLTKVQQEPYLNPSINAHYEVFNWVNKNKIKVLLTGEGADEVFGGYSKVYQPTLFLSALKQFDFNTMAKLLSDRNVSFFKIIKKLSFLLPNSININLLKFFRSKNNFLKEEFTRNSEPSFKNWIIQQKSSLKDRLDFDIKCSNIPHVLRNADRNSMRNSIELRHPYLDFNVVKLAMKMPIEYRTGIIGKIALRKISNDYGIPFSFKPKSVGFGNSYEFNYKSKELNEYILDNSILWDDICSKKKLLKNMNSTHNKDLTFWRSISLILWLIYIGNKKNNLS